MFQVGNLGNRKGRSVKKRDQACDLAEKIFLGEQIAKINGEKCKVSSIELIFIKLREQAQKGDIRSTKLLFELVDKYGISGDKITIIPPFVPSKAELREEWAHELDDDDHDDL